MTFIEKIKKRPGLILAAAVVVLLAGCGPENPAGNPDGTGNGDKGVGDRLAGKIPYKFNITETYKNNLEIEGQHGVSQFTNGGEYGIGDPFVMRYNGKYYLYPSSCEQQVRVYESTDLIHWEYKGYATDSNDVYFAYAPEVVYYDGMFYMCTSPGGKGHYILKSESPLGPFRNVTGNFGHVIDGSFWITDEDKLFFVYPESQIIKSTELDTSKMLPRPKKINLNATLRGWTEGPGIFRRGDYHYLTYTGNNVVSTGYRVAYSYTKGDDPFGQYIMPDDNILLMRSEHEDPFNGLGHSSDVIGPDLDSIYSPYHNLIGLAGPQRRYNLDRLLTNGGVVYSTGDTDFEVPVPSMPQIYGWFDDPDDSSANESFTVTEDGIESKTSVSGVFTAEYCFRLSDADKQPVDLKFGINGSSWWSIRIDTASNTLSLISTKNGAETSIASAGIKVSHGYQKLNTVRIENTEAVTYIYFNSARKLKVEKAGISGGKIGAYGSNAQFGYIGANSDALGTGDFDSVKNIPGKFAAMHYLKGENTGFNILNAAAKADGMRHSEKENSTILKDGSYSLILDTPGDWTTYSINVAADGMYGVAARINPDSSGTVYEWIVDDDPAQTYRFTVPETGVAKADTASINLGRLKLEAGFHTLTLHLVEGRMEANMFELYSVPEEPWVYESEFSPSKDRREWLFLGPWRLSNGKLTIKGTEDGLALVGKPGISDYVIDLDVDFPKSGAGDSGLMFRVTNPSLKSAQARESFIGYGLRINKSSLTLSKYNYGKIGSSKIIKIKDGNDADSIRIKVIVSNNVIRIYQNEETEPSMEFIDPQPWLYGRVGFYSFGRELTVNRLSVAPIE